MKLRTDFVTNSSSGSFVIARKGGLTEKQKAAIISFVEERLLCGDEDETVTPENLDKLADYGWIDEDMKEDVQKYLKKGFRVTSGRICFADDSPYFSWGSIHTDLWELLERTDPENFCVLDDNLDY